ncbi:MarR family winged helix-turn-helix transcriptional regulator [Streptomyces sp. NBC_01320]|uniref:MarR family winged helix-turn-helix transcriptional regulator n=1 Tax=Streptomyces sp. NBC_01320 TaxID=2903824 RepID=UPI002E15EF97|nr:MarR family winged helix-turn-helix transcriptional regulator [Streptomyces sp. NBC_01320]
MTEREAKRKRLDVPRSRPIAEDSDRSSMRSASAAEVPFDLSSNVNYLLRSAHQRADELFAEAMTGLDVTPRQATLLFVIGKNEGASLSDLTRYSGIDRGSISGMVPRLERRGLLTQSRADSDGRAKALTLTPSGEALVHDVVHRTEGLAERVLGSLPEEYRQLFVKMLRQMVGVEVETRVSSEAL